LGLSFPPVSLKPSDLPLLHRSGLLSKLNFALKINGYKDDHDGLGEVGHEMAWNIFEHLINAAMPMSRFKNPHHPFYFILFGAQRLYYIYIYIFRKHTILRLQS
jgi:hypothetical protein